MAEKKNVEESDITKKKQQIEPDHEEISIVRQCELLELSRSSYYYKPAQESPLNLELMRKLDEQYMKTPFYGSRRMTEWLKREGYDVNRKRVQRLMELLGIEGLSPKKKATSTESTQHRIYPYLLTDVSIERPDQVWSTDITYVPILGGFMYLVAVIDWYSRYVLSWRLSNTMDVSFCLDALDTALSSGRLPDIFNSDQGSQFTSLSFTSRLQQAGIPISMDGRGRCFDNIFIERLWRTVKYEDLYIKSYDSVPALFSGISDYFRFYNHERLHQSLGYRTPAEVYYAV